MNMNNRMPSVPLLSVICTFVLIVSGCGNVRNLPLGSDLGTTTQDSPLQVFISGLSTVAQSLNTTENIAAISSTSSCPSQTSACTDKKRSIEYNSCSAGSYTAAGTIALTYNTDLGCNESIVGIPSGGTTVTRTTQSFILTAANGVTTKTSSEPFSNYLGSPVGGGETLFIIGPQSFSLNINGFTRVRAATDGTVFFSHSMRTTLPLIVSGSRTTNNRNINNGSMLIDNNGSRYSSVLQFFSVAYAGTCCHPVSGNMTATYTGSFNSTISMTFKSSPCGSAEITTMAGGNTSTTNVVLPPCE